MFVVNKWVVKQGLYRLASPAELSPSLFAIFVTISDNELFEKLLSLDSSDLDTLVLLPITHLEIIATNTSLSELAWLSEYLAQIDVEEARDIATQLADGSLSIVTLQEQVPMGQQVVQTELSSDSPVQRLVDPAEPFFASPVLVASLFLLVVLIGWGAMAAIWRTRRSVSQ